MLERIREGAQGTWAAVILGLVALSFVFAGVGSYVTSSVEEAAASVNGEDITMASFERAYENQRAQREAQMGEGFSALMANAAFLKQFRSQVLDGLIDQEVMDQAAKDMGLRASDAQVKDAILGMSEFQIGGQFNNDRYLAIIRNAGFQIDSFREYMRTELTRMQLTQALLGSEFVLPDEALRAYMLQRQSRTGRYLSIDASDFSAAAQISEEEIALFYSENLEQYDTQERIKVAFVELKTSDLTDKVSVSDEEIAQYYQDNLMNYQSEEERKVAHILISNEAEDAAQKADELSEELAGGADFAALAAAHSDDIVSAEVGGELEWFTKGVMDPAFEQAAFALNSGGDVSAPVESEFGYHIIKLIDVKPSSTIELAKVKDDIQQALVEDKALTEFYALQQEMDQLAFEMPEELTEVAAAAGTSIQTSEFFARNEAEGPFANVEVLTRVFSDELINQGVNSEVIELEEGHVVVARVVEHQPQRTQPLEEVRDEIIAELREQKALDAARSFANDLMASLMAGEDISALLEEKGLSWVALEKVQRFSPETPREVLESLFSLSQDDAFAQVDLVGTSVAVVAFEQVHKAEAPSETELAGMRQQLSNMFARETMSSVIESLTDAADVVKHL